MRRQEILLGVGGVKALKAVGVKPTVLHLNEGHAAFAPVKAVTDLLGKKWDTDKAIAEVKGWNEQILEMAKGILHQHPRGFVFRRRQRLPDERRVVRVQVHLYVATGDR